MALVALEEIVVDTTETDTNPLLALDDHELVARLCPPTTVDAWTFTAQEIREALQGERVLCPSIELSNACNLNCPYCYVEHANSLKKEQYEDQLTTAQIEDLVRLLADAGAKTINLIGAGEPTVDPAFEKTVRLIASLKIKPLVATNGIKIATSPHILATIIETNATVVLKYNSRDSRLQDFLVGSKGYAALRDKAFDLLINAGLNKEHPSRLALNSLLMQANVDEILPLQEFCRRNNIVLIAGDYMPTGRTSGGEFRGELVLDKSKDACGAELEMFKPLECSQRDSLAQKMAEFDSRLGLTLVPVMAYISGVPCVQSLGVCVDNRGQIWHCPARQRLTGHYLEPNSVATLSKETNFKSLWNSDKYLKVSRRQYDGRCLYKYPLATNQRTINT